MNNKPIRLIELFGGIGSQAMALSKLRVNFEHYRLVEFDKYPVASYNAIHGTNFEPSDITKIHGKDLGIVDTNDFCYLMTYSFPCQDLSVAGKQRGMSKGDGTRSGLLWEVERLLTETDNLPQLLLMENVPQVHGSKNISDFNSWIEFLENKGYSNFYQDLNAKDYGVAQNRNRCFMVSILGEHCFTFPKPQPLDKVMKDYLEDNVDEKYYISSEKAQSLIDKLDITTSSERERNCIDFTTNNPQRKELANCITTRDRGISNRKSEGTGVIEIDYRKIIVIGNYSPSNHDASRIVSSEGIAPTVKENHGTVTATNTCDLKIRKLTPKECYRLMGFDDVAFEKAAQVNSNTQLYKQAGNSIVVDVLVAIFDNLLVHRRSVWLDELLSDKEVL